MNSTKVVNDLIDLLNELLAYGNQEDSFIFTGIDLETMKISFDFDIVVVEEDNYIGFAGY